ncbi:NrsF family protein [Mesorhizobium sp. LHD-90]|uniref:NrsF family protein n=1 Tax=Mesorhizobium sp. LHD-90 TaxID=3071414 RepID=UPI0027DEBD1F|nr:NrsF family protein [Mesorhizobium sp. LHD-90]MDQ6436138.1 NrsF family protein [Mesorhizobium sp. LHD-90]
MDTESLIRGLAGDAKQAGPRLSAVLAGALAVAVAVAGLAFFAMLGPRPDIALAAETPRFLFKFVVTLALALTAAGAFSALARPGAPVAWRLLAAAPLLVLAAVAVELLLVPQDQWEARWIGANAAQCLTFIPLIALGPLAILLWAMRRGAPTRPRAAGALAGLLAGGIAATFYAAHCADDSPLFVATWYTLAIVLLTAVGATAGARLLRW